MTHVYTIIINYYVLMEQLLLNLKPKILHTNLQLKLYPNNKHKIKFVSCPIEVCKVHTGGGLILILLRIRAKKWSTKKLI